MNKNYIILILVFLLGITSAYAIKSNVHIIIFGKGEISDFIESFKNNGREPVFDKDVVGQTAPDFSLTKLNGGKMNLADYKGNLVILNFWASWCPPCRAEIPAFVKVQQKYKDNGVAFLGVAIEDKEDVENYVKEVTLNYPTSYGVEEAYEVSAKYGNPDGALPYTLVISPKQKILESYNGQVSEETLEEVIKQHLLN